MVGFTLIWASSSVSPPPMAMIVTKKGGSLRGFRNNDGGGGDGFPSFLPKEVQNIRDPYARTLAQRIVRLPVKVMSFLCIELWVKYPIKLWLLW